MNELTWERFQGLSSGEPEHAFSIRIQAPTDEVWQAIYDLVVSSHGTPLPNVVQYHDGTTAIAPPGAVSAALDAPKVHSSSPTSTASESTGLSILQRSSSWMSGPTPCPHRNNTSFSWPSWSVLRQLQGGRSTLRSTRMSTRSTCGSNRDATTNPEH